MQRTALQRHTQHRQACSEGKQNTSVCVSHNFSVHLQRRQPWALQQQRPLHAALHPHSTLAHPRFTFCIQQEHAASAAPGNRGWPPCGVGCKPAHRHTCQLIQWAPCPCTAPAAVQRRQCSTRDAVGHRQWLPVNLCSKHGARALHQRPCSAGATCSLRKWCRWLLACMLPRDATPTPTLLPAQNAALSTHGHT